MATIDRTQFENGIELDSRIVDAVANGVVNFDNAWFTNNGIATDVMTKGRMGILSCPRAQPSGGDVAYLLINGIKCRFKGTSNLTTEEYQKYCSGGSGTGYVRTAGPAAPVAVPFTDWLAALKQFKAAGLDPAIIPNVPKSFNITLEDVMALI